jgi:hypothetical protein
MLFTYPASFGFAPFALVVRRATPVLRRVEVERRAVLERELEVVLETMVILFRVVGGGTA